MPETSYPLDWPVSRAIETLLAVLRNHPDVVEGLAIKVAERPDVARRVGKRWGEVSQGEGNIIARKVGLIARDVVLGAGSVTQSGGEHLH